MKKQSDPKRIGTAAAVMPLSSADPQIRRNVADEVLHALRTRWDVLVVITLATALLAWGLSAMQSKVYRATATAALAPSQSLTPADQLRGVQALDTSTFVATVAAMAGTPAISSRAIPNAEEGYSIRAVVMPNTNLLRIEVDGADANRAAQIANGVPAVLSAETRRVFGIYGVTTISPASGGEVIFPRTARVTAAGILIGLILGTTVAWAMSRPRRPSSAIAGGA